MTDLPPAPWWDEEAEEQRPWIPPDTLRLVLVALVALTILLASLVVAQEPGVYDCSPTQRKEQHERDHGGDTTRTTARTTAGAGSHPHPCP